MKIIIAMKSTKGNFANNVIQYSIGGFNIDENRIEFKDDKDKKSATFGVQTDIRGNNYNTNKPSNGNILAKNVEANPLGRYPANIILEQETANILDNLTGLLKSGDNCVRTKPAYNVYHGGDTKSFAAGAKQVSYGDVGGASRFFTVIGEQK